MLFFYIIGLTVETINYGKTKFVAWDVGGRDKSVRFNIFFSCMILYAQKWKLSLVYLHHYCCMQRPLMRLYYPNTEVLLFVVDSSDHDRIQECKEELWNLLREDMLKDAIILIMANKQDLPNAMSATDVAKKLEVHNIRNRKICKYFIN